MKILSTIFKIFSIFDIGTSHTASSEDNDLDREAAGDSGFSDGKYLLDTLTITTPFNVIITNYAYDERGIHYFHLYSGMATPPTSNCDDVSQDSSGAFSFNQNINSSTNTSISKAANESRHRNGCSTNYKGSISKSIFVNAQFY